MDETFVLIPLNGEARRQYINAREAFLAERATVVEARELDGDMRWRNSKDGEYLTRVFKGRISKNLGLRSPETEAVYQAFCVRRSKVADRLKHLRERLQLHSKLNRAYDLHCVDSMTIRILRAFSSAGIEEGIHVVGSSALFAYQFLAGVRIGNYGLPSGRSRSARVSFRHLSLVASESLCANRLKKLLSRIDKSFALERRGSVVRASNKAGYELEIFDCAGWSIETRADHDWASERRDIRWLLSGPKVQTVIVGAMGTMALMTTVDPRAYILHRIWASSADFNASFTKASDEEDVKLLVKLVHHYLPQYDLSDLNCLSQDVCTALATLRVRNGD